MITISKEEAKIVREKFPNVHIVRTMKQNSNRGHYYCEESKKVISFIRNLRERKISERYGDVGYRI